MSDNSTETRARERIGTISDLMHRYSIDAGDAWRIVAGSTPVRNPDGDLVQIVANPDEREGTTWIIYEEPTP